MKVPISMPESKAVIYVDKGPSPSASLACKGSGQPIEKQTCHITVTVGD